jgi:hypothetical protein
MRCDIALRQSGKCEFSPMSGDLLFLIKNSTAPGNFLKTFGAGVDVKVNKLNDIAVDDHALAVFKMRLSMPIPSPFSCISSGCSAVVNCL